MPSVATPGYGSVVPNAPKTPARQMRISDADWNDFDALAKVMGADRATLVREYIQWQLRRPGVKLRERLPKEEVDKLIQRPATHGE